eukprot:CAMPEP_0177630162 /NCGR_PEP_ID=MMETSP0447-20121125/1065_1 /TAXON_ID=0 /ORGANISM="Stygamoeba regulata, Strain BSH-02190019" /LENGTH=226 /DNA_ID=CAMNT_0019131553 /DNA_START=283 /DNA_END=963 /DNA_ORIENTATION=-
MSLTGLVVVFLFFSVATADPSLPDWGPEMSYSTFINSVQYSKSAGIISTKFVTDYGYQLLQVNCKKLTATMCIINDISSSCYNAGPRAMSEACPLSENAFQYILKAVLDGESGSRNTTFMGEVTDQQGKDLLVWRFNEQFNGGQYFWETSETHPLLRTPIATQLYEYRGETPIYVIDFKREAGDFSLPAPVLPLNLPYPNEHGQAITQSPITLSSVLRNFLLQARM